MRNDIFDKLMKLPVGFFDRNQAGDIISRVSYETDEKFTAPLPKVIDTRTKVVQHYGFVERVDLGLYVDIFPLDYGQRDFTKTLSYLNKTTFIRKLLLRFFLC